MTSGEVETTIRILFEADQAERTVGWDNIDFATMRQNDAVRLSQAKELYTKVKEGQFNISGQHLYELGLLFQHSPETADLLVAKELGELSGDKGCMEGAWLSAAAEDRYLLKTTGKQKWGTQFQKNEAGDWEQAPMLHDTESGASDRLRAEKNVPPRTEQLRVFLARKDI